MSLPPPPTNCLVLHAAQLSNIAYFSAVSNDTQEAVASLLEDLPWVERYLEGNRAMLSERAGLARQAALRCGELSRVLAPMQRPVAPQTPRLLTGLPSLPAAAGMFIWVDLRAPLRAFSLSRRGLPSASAPAAPTAAPPTWDDEAAFHREILARARVVLTPGAACHAAEPGFARCCFAWMGPASVEVAFERLGALFKEWSHVPA